ncbi:MAG: outer membrane beta-barrel protein [Microscillaceae bacterium]|nr:outer membrane beta-barrel protein [Microscillaceae bacterium]
MKRFILLYLLLSPGILFAQEETYKSKFYLGLSYGTSFSVGDFKDTDLENPDAGFAKNGQKFDLFMGFPIDDKITITEVFRYQSFNTEVEDLINDYKADNPGVQITGRTEDWQAFYLLVGLAYQINITKKLSFSPRFGLGPLFVKNPGITVSNPDGVISQSFNRSSESGFGLGYEIGFGVSNNFGKHFSLMPTFTFSGAYVQIKDVITSIDNVQLVSDYTPKILSFNIGIALAYRFY